MAREKDCKILTFTAKTTESSRTKLYDIFAKLIDTKTNWKFLKRRNGGNQFSAGYHLYVFCTKDIASEVEKRIDYNAIL